jgi:hypothetical protein
VQMARQSAKFKVTLKYCGSCNPYVDLTRIARHVVGLIERHEEFEKVPPFEKDITVAVILCGCHRACGNKQDVRPRSEQYLVVAGESFMGQYVSEGNLPIVVCQRFLEILEKLRNEAL